MKYLIKLLKIKLIILVLALFPNCGSPYRMQQCKIYTFLGQPKSDREVKEMIRFFEIIYNARVEIESKDKDAIDVNINANWGTVIVTVIGKASTEQYEFELSEPHVFDAQVMNTRASEIEDFAITLNCDCKGVVE